MEDADGIPISPSNIHATERWHNVLFTVDKGSVTVNGVSLTVCEPTDNSFKVAIIPYTRENTNLLTLILALW